MFARRERWWLTTIATLASVCFASVVVAEALHTSRDKPPRGPRGTAERERPHVSASSPFDYAERAAAARRIGAQILARNLFDAQTGPLTWDAPSAPPAGLPEEPPALAALQPEETPRCAANLRLVASLVRHTAQHSMATIRKDDRTYLIAAGGELDDLTLLSVLPSAVYLRARSGAYCLLRFLEPGGSPPNGQAASRSAPPAPERKPTANAFFAHDELAQGVRSLGEGEYAVSRKLVLRALSDPGKAAAGALFGPSRRKGEPGMEIRAIKEGTLLQRMGLQDGDIVRSLSGADLTNASGLLDALRTVRQADSVSLVLVRDHVARTVEYLLD